MVYTNLTKLAMKIAFESHKDQVDKSGLPYIYHLIHIEEQMEDELFVCTALLHDVVEDTQMTFQDLQNLGICIEVIESIKLLTRDDRIPYMEYVARIKQNPIARKVKLADLKHNSDLTRLDVVDDNSTKRVEKYKKAICILTEV